MQNNRRQFLGSLARGLLLPIGGGALALADPAKAAGLQVTQGALPLSADALRLRSLRRDLRRCRESQNDYPSLDAYRGPGGRSGRGQSAGGAYPGAAGHVVDGLLGIGGAGVVGQQHRGVDRYTDHAAVALTKAVMGLGGGDRLFLWDTEKA